MTVVFLARHGQASLGAADYDRLSDPGERQAARLGAVLAERGITPDRVVHGSLTRHSQTASHAGFVDTVIDPRWNEIDHVPIMGAMPADDHGTDDGKQHWQNAKRRWASGGHDADYPESYAAFGQRITEALKAAAAGLDSGQTAVVVTSAGPIAAVINQWLGAGPDVWQRVQTVTVNAALTKVLVSARRTTVLSFNDHSYLAKDAITYG